MQKMSTLYKYIFMYINNFKNLKFYNNFKEGQFTFFYLL